jgi:hypothetical protein
MVPAVGKVNRKTDEHPDDEPQPVATGKENINKRQEALPSGSLRRMISTAVQTMVNASSAATGPTSVRSKWWISKH